jgi:hypothetical protein
MTLLDDLGGFLDDARTQLANVDQVVRQGEALHSQLSGGGSSGTTAPPAQDMADTMVSTSKWLVPVMVIGGALLIYALARGARR